MNNRSLFQEDERLLSGRLDNNLTAVRQFDLSTFDIDSARFLRDLVPSFDQLSWDYYDARLAQVNFLLRHHRGQEERLQSFLPAYYAGRKDLLEIRDLIQSLPNEAQQSFESIRPHRQRSLASFVVSENDEVQRIPMGTFRQDLGVKDYRAMARVFDETPTEVIAHPEFRHLLAGVIEMVSEAAAPQRARKLVFHQVRTVARLRTPGIVVPEGIHQDGADYIVSALVLERQGIVGGESTVYGPDRTTPYLRTLLQPGQGLFHADSRSPLWHGVSPIKVDPQGNHSEGRRSIFGFDIHL